MQTERVRGAHLLIRSLPMWRAVKPNSRARSWGSYIRWELRVKSVVIKASWISSNSDKRWNESNYSLIHLAFRVPETALVHRPAYLCCITWMSNLLIGYANEDEAKWWFYNLQLLWASGISCAENGRTRFNSFFSSMWRSIIIYNIFHMRTETF